jgi:hypothetical protein
MKTVEVDVWLRGTTHATTHLADSVSADSANWTDVDVRALLTGMLQAIRREQDPGADPAAISLRGFSWIVSPDPAGGVLVHLEMQSGTASAGPFVIDERKLTGMIARVLQMPGVPSANVH